MHSEKSKFVDFVFVLVLCATFAAMGVRAVADEVHALRPDLGDIVSFAGVSPDPDMAVILSAARAGAPGGSACTLDSSVMARSGGSLFIEAKTAPAGLFRVHWAGGATGPGRTGCGPSAELLLSPDQIEQLAGTVGGFGPAGAREGDPGTMVAPPAVSE